MKVKQEQVAVGSEIASVADDVFMQKKTRDASKDDLRKIYHQYKGQVSKVDFNSQVKSIFESTRSCYQMLIDDFEGVENVIEV